MESPITEQTIRRQLDDSRRDLLDLSTRNRLISLPIGSKSARIIQIFDEQSEEVYRRLVTEKKTFTFLAGKGQAQPVGTDESQVDIELLVDLPLPDDEVDPVSGKAKRHTDSRLQTRLSPEVLQRRLFDLHNEARTIVEEQGVNILYLALGFLRWIDQTNQRTERVAPLLLIPVDLIRQSISDRFAIRWREEELQDNLSLAEKISIEYGVNLPRINADEQDGFALNSYFDNVADVVKVLPGWAVEPDSMCLGFFSFAKFLMYKDLDITSWPASHSPLTHPLLHRLLVGHDRDSYQPADLSWTGSERIDDYLPAERLDHVVDADSSQTVAIELVRQGQDVVIQGPPGTGKSQTITNIIATAVLDGKKVLFLAEKLAALEVVKSRLEREGLGVLCLELHSNKARKSAVAGELKATWDLGNPAADGLSELNQTLTKQRLVLNQHPLRLHTTESADRLSVFDHIGLLAYHGLPQGEAILLSFPGAETWTRQDIASQEAHIQSLTGRLDAIGNPLVHPWRGVGLTQYTGLERQRIDELIHQLTTNLAAQTQLATQLAESLHVEVAPLTLASIARLQQLAYLASQRPVDQLETIQQPIWEQAPVAIRSLATTKQRFEQLMATLPQSVPLAVWQADWQAAQQQLLTYGQKWYKPLIGSYRQAMRQVAADLSGPLPARYADRADLLSQVVEGQQAYQVLQTKQSLGQQAFGGLWEEAGNGARLVRIAGWIDQLSQGGYDATERARALAVDSTQMARQATALQTLLDSFQTHWQALSALLTLSVAPYVDDLAESAIPISQWQAALTTWQSALDQLLDWTAWQYERQRGQQSPLASLLVLLERGTLPADQVLITFRRAVAHQQLSHLFGQQPALTSFDGALHNQQVRQFQRLDRQRLDLAKVNVLTSHYQHIPPKRPVGAVGTVLGEANKQRAHRPIRQLLSQAGSVVQDLKPVFMMSPLSVAQFLEPGKLTFDLLVIDEASQVKPVDALGAIARCRQIVVVGDDKQLPPSNFFAKMTSNDSAQDGEEEEGEAGLVKAKEMESVLSLGKGRGLTDTLLRWHYRSKHHSLIAVSNKRYYENKLYVVPSPWKQTAGLGLIWRPVNGVYDRAGNRANAVEARAVAEAVIHHATHHPDQTLGVAAFSMAQQRAIQDELERLRRQTPQGEDFFTRYPHEPFFVKNLENVQGDERDVIFLSVGYGRDTYGKLSMNFGPLNRQGGERRLNVLISRARKRCEVFTSITDQDIELSATTGEGVAGLKQFLHYTRTGQLEVAQSSSRPMDSPFEEAVKEALESRFGWEVHTQVGVAGFFIDLAIVDPDRKGRYILGIECDGVAYHSSPSARERDRLRQSILESQGWIIHRLWGIDFFRKKEQELAKIKAAYEEALALLTDADQIALVKPEAEQNVFHLVRTQQEAASFAVPYQVAPRLAVPNPDPYQLYPVQISALVHEILTVEAPMHIDELVTRMREQWGWAKAGDKFRALVAQGVAVLEQDQRIHQQGPYITLPERPVTVRVRGEQAPAGTRKVAHIPPTEIDMALEYVTRLARMLSRDEAAKEVSSLLGFKSLSTDLRTCIGARIDHLLNQHVLQENKGILSINQA